jgi:hypothetical protein
LQTWPGAGQQDSAPTPAFPPQVLPLKLVFSIDWQSPFVRHSPYGGAVLQEWKVGSQIPVQQSESSLHAAYACMQHDPVVAGATILQPAEAVQSAFDWQGQPGAPRQVYGEPTPEVQASPSQQGLAEHPLPKAPQQTFEAVPW